MAAVVQQVAEWRLQQPREHEIQVGEIARQAAEREQQTRAHALCNIGAAKIQLDVNATSDLLEAHQVADSAGERYEAARALNNLCYTMMCWAQRGCRTTENSFRRS